MTPASASTSRSTSPEPASRCHSCESTDDCASDTSQKLLRSAEKDVYQAMKSIASQSRQPVGVLPRGKFTQLMVAHAYKGWTNMKMLTKPPVLQPATGEPRRVRTPKPNLRVKRFRHQLSADSDDPDADPDYTPRPRERKKSKVQAMISKIESSGDEAVFTTQEATPDKTSLSKAKKTITTTSTSI